METLFVYGDESGTMPEKKADGPFVTCCVATPDEVPSFPSIRGKFEWAMSKVKEHRATPHFTYVLPGDDYDEKYAIRMSKMNTMAKYTRFTTGENAHYLTEDGFNPQNYVWIRSMSNSIGQLLVGELFRNKIDAINIILDQKSIATPNRNFFIKQVMEIDQPIIRVLKRIYRMNPREAERVAQNINFVGNISINWSDDPEINKNNGGLILSHILSKRFLRQLKSEEYKNSKLEKKFEQSGFKNHYRDITPDMLQLDKRAVEEWKRSSGLPEPEA